MNSLVVRQKFCCCFVFKEYNCFHHTAAAAIVVVVAVVTTTTTTNTTTTTTTNTTTTTTNIEVPAGTSPRGGDVTVYVFDINQPSLPTPFHFVLVSVSTFMALSTVFHSIKSPDNTPLSHSVLPVLFLPCWSFQLYISL